MKLVMTNTVSHEGKYTILHIILMENVVLCNEYGLKMRFKSKV